MIRDLQKANMWKRISAALADLIILVVVIEGAILLLAAAFDFGSYMEQRTALEQKYIEQYGVDRDITEEELNAMPEEQRNTYKAKVEAANRAYQSDPAVAEVFGKLYSLAVMIATISILFAFVVLELIVPLILKNGQTIGKKIFGVAVMRIDGVKVSPVIVFARGILGKCTIGTLVPIYLLMMVIFGILGIVGLAVLAALLIAQVILFFATEYHTPIHDKFAQTLTVDMASQRIFDSVEEMLEYQKQIAAEEAETRER